MRFHTSLIDRTVSKTREFKDIRKLFFFGILYGEVKFLEAILFNKQLDRNYPDKFNLLNKKYFQEKFTNNNIDFSLKILERIFTDIEKESPDIVRFRADFEKIIIERKLNEDIFSSTWFPGVLGFEDIN